MTSAERDEAHLHRATATSGAVAFLARSAQAVISLGVSLLMARLLTPGDFGVFAMVMPLGIFGMIAANYCVQAALLQHPATSDDELQAYYHVAVRIALGAAAAMGVLGVVLSLFYEEPRVPAIALALAAVVTLMPRAAMQEAMLKRALRFPVVHAVQLSTWSLGLFTGVVVAWQGGGYWALPLQIITMELARLAVINLVSDWRPRPRRETAKISTVVLRRAWASLLGLRLASWLNDQPELLVVGRIGGSVVLGNYGTARRWAWYPFEDPFLALTEVAIASVGRVRDDAEHFKRLISRSMLAMLALSLPLVAFITVEAGSVVHVLLGDQWAGAVPFLRILGVAAFFAMITRTSTWILLARGATDRLLHWALTRQLPATVIAAGAGLAWGAKGVAIGMASLAMLLVIPTIRYVVEGTSMRTGDVLRAIARPVGASLLAAAAIAAAAPWLTPLMPATRLVASLAAFLASFVAAWVALPGGVRDTAALIGAARSLVTPTERVA